MQVMIADDAVLFREGLARVLQAAGIEVAAQVGDDEQLLARVWADPPEAVVVDIRMPPTHTAEGLEAARRIRAEPPGWGCWCCRSTSSRIMPCSCSRTAPAASATCSRTASPTLVRWSTPCAASSPCWRSCEHDCATSRPDAARNPRAGPKIEG
jgi:CheY-like chemotaxis protein